MPKRMMLKRLYDPSKDGKVPTVDLVLVHGLNGDPIQTWSSSQEPGSGWPQRLLPEIQPLTRVLSFGYNADIYHNNSTAGIRDNATALLAQLGTLRQGPQAAKRPIVFLAHCLGGLIVKQAMAFANTVTDHKAVGSATKTIIFLGTPHLGADKRRWELLATRLSHFARPIRNGEISHLVNAIKKHAEDLSEIGEDFRHHAVKYTIISFYETDKWKGTNEPIVDKTSAMIGIENELMVAVGGDHLTICHFEGGVDDPNFEMICQLIQKASGKVPEEAPAEGVDEGVAGLNGGPAVPPARSEPTENEEPVELPPQRAGGGDRAEAPLPPDAPVGVHRSVWVKEESTRITKTTVVASAIPGPPAPATKTGPEREAQGEEGRPKMAKPRGVSRILKKWLD